MRKPLAVAALTLAIFSAGVVPALADSGKPRPIPPGEPRGLNQSGVERPEEAAFPQTGPANRDNSPKF